MGGEGRDPPPPPLLLACWCARAAWNMESIMDGVCGVRVGGGEVAFPGPTGVDGPPREVK